MHRKAAAMACELAESLDRPNPEPEWYVPFLAELEQTGNVSLAVRVAGVGRQTAYRHRSASEEFADAWDQAIELGADPLEDEAKARVFDRNDKASHIVLMFLLKGLRPEKYRSDSDLKRFAEKFACSRDQPNPEASKGALMGAEEVMRDFDETVGHPKKAKRNESL